MLQQKATTVTSKGQVTIPAGTRRALGIRPGDKVVFEVEGGTARLRKASGPVRDAFGAVKPRRKPENWEELWNDTRDWVAEQALKEMRDA